MKALLLAVKCKKINRRTVHCIKMIDIFANY